MVDPDAQRAAADRIASEYESARISPNVGPNADRYVVSCPDGRSVVVGPSGDVIADSRNSGTTPSEAPLRGQKRSACSRSYLAASGAGISRQRTTINSVLRGQWTSSSCTTATTLRLRSSSALDTGIASSGNDPARNAE